MDIPLIHSGQTEVRKLGESHQTLPKVLDFGAVLMAAIDGGASTALHEVSGEADLLNDGFVPKSQGAEPIDAPELNQPAGQTFPERLDFDTDFMARAEGVPRSSLAVEQGGAGPTREVSEPESTLAEVLVLEDNVSTLSHFEAPKGGTDLSRSVPDSELGYWRTALEGAGFVPIEPTHQQAPQHSIELETKGSDLSAKPMRATIEQGLMQTPRSDLPQKGHSDVASNQNQSALDPDQLAPNIKFVTSAPLPKGSDGVTSGLGIGPLERPQPPQALAEFPRQKPGSEPVSAKIVSPATLPNPTATTVLQPWSSAQQVRPAEQRGEAVSTHASSPQSTALGERIIQSHVSVSEPPRISQSQDNHGGAPPRTVLNNDLPSRGRAAVISAPSGGSALSISDGIWPSFSVSEGLAPVGRDQVALPAALDPAQRPDLPRAVVQQLADVLPRASRQGVEITLSPEELGRVRLTVSTNDAGGTLMVAADRPETMDLIRRHLDVLLQTFRDQGYSGLNVSLGSHGNAAFEQRGFSGAVQGQPDPDVTGAETSETAGARLQPTLQFPADGLDIRL